MTPADLDAIRARLAAGRECGKYLGDNFGTCPKLTCVRPPGHALCDNVRGEWDDIAALVAEVERLRGLLARLVVAGSPHESATCPEDDTCECELRRDIDAALREGP